MFVFNESMLHDGTATNKDVESGQKTSVHVEHVPFPSIIIFLFGEPLF
jgi:hypothetical protein